MGVTSFAKNRQIIGNKVILVPYSAQHVPKYHEWMKNPTLQYLTASEPLTLDEEFEMQQKWVKDENKCTFIVLDRLKFESTNDEVASMIGDTNVYFFDENDLSIGEIELMVAEESERGKGYGKEILALMMRFSMDIIGVKTFEAKIKIDNPTSIRLFESFHFVETSRSQMFNEVTLSFCCTNQDAVKFIQKHSNFINYNLIVQ